MTRERLKASFAKRTRQSGQAMTEYVVVTFFAFVFFFGPGLDILEELANVMRRNYEGYSYAISMSPLPDYGTGPLMRDALTEEGIDAATIDQLSVDPIETAINDNIDELTDLSAQIDNILGLFTDITVEEIIDEALDSFVSIFPE